jgi:pullulanase/glycogen debranching enzyme
MTARTFRACSDAVNRNRGSSFPLGATVCPGGVNFSVFSKNATAVELLFFDRTNDPVPVRTIHLDPKKNKTYHYWHIYVPDIQAGQIYGYRVQGPFEPERGMRFDPQKVLLNPYGKAVVIPETFNRFLTSKPGIVLLTSCCIQFTEGILSRDEHGRPLENPPVLWDIETDPALAGIKLIAEAWDAAGLYQVGTFIGDRWKEQSINFITCHDGFTLNDLVSYNHKHNEANGENNRDGSDNNLSWNCGGEGPTDDPEIEKLRNRQVKNFHAITLLAAGAPMILMGDEVRRTQRENNNASATWIRRL